MQHEQQPAAKQHLGQYRLAGQEGLQQHHREEQLLWDGVSCQEQVQLVKQQQQQGLLGLEE
jgi:hypothetical protein